MGITLVMGSPKLSGRRLIWTVFDEVNASDRPISVPRIAGNPGPWNRALRRTRWQVRPAQHPSPTVRVLAPARLPRQTDLLSAVECLSEPVPTTLVSGRTRVVRIEQDVRVEDDHR